jgi:hypothetical protein
MPEKSVINITAMILEGICSEILREDLRGSGRGIV